MNIVSARGSFVRLVSLYPDLLGTYGDAGNVLILANRLRWRGQRVELVTVNSGDPVPTSGDLYVLGGGEDGARDAAVHALLPSPRASSPLENALSAGAQLLAVCAGLQITGEWFASADGTRTRGLALADLRTSRLPMRAVGEVLADPDPRIGVPPLSGFENHAGSTDLGSGTSPLGQVRRGTGNGPSQPSAGRPEGLLTDAIVGTYLHGPVLARNPELADVLISRALGTPIAQLSPLEVAEHAALRKRLGADR